MTRRILYIEDELGLSEDVVLELTDAGYSAEGVTTGPAALAALRDKRYDLVLCDVQVPGLSGLDLLEMHKGPGHPVFIMLTAYSDPSLQKRCTDLGARAVLVKPVDYCELLSVVASELRE